MSEIHVEVPYSLHYSHSNNLDMDQLIPCCMIFYDSMILWLFMPIARHLCAHVLLRAIGVHNTLAACQLWHACLGLPIPCITVHPSGEAINCCWAKSKMTPKLMRLGYWPSYQNSAHFFWTYFFVGRRLFWGE